MKRRALAEQLRGRIQPAGYVSFVSALVHHEVLIDALTVIQVASPDRVGRCYAVSPGPVEYLEIPRDLFFGWRVEHFEGQLVPVATPEKALLDWVCWCEERGVDARLDEIEWDQLDRGELDRLATATGIDYRTHLVGLEALADSAHDQGRLRLDSLTSAQS